MQERPIVVALLCVAMSASEENVGRTLDRLRHAEALALSGRRATTAHERARFVRSPETVLRRVDALGVTVGVGCAFVVREGNSTMEFRSAKTRRVFDVRNLGKNDLQRSLGESAVLCRLRPRKGRVEDDDVAFLTSASDGAYLWHYWRWILNKLCASSSSSHPYYLFVGAPLRGQKRRRDATECPATQEESLAHTSKALSLFLALKLRLAKRFVFLDADVWYSNVADTTPLWRRWLAATRDARVALPAPCYKQFFGAAVVAVTASDWTLGFLAEWFQLRCGPKDQPALWSLVLRAAGRHSDAAKVLALYQDRRCLNETTGELTKSDCSCEDAASKHAECGYYAAWRTANNAFLDLWGPDVVDAPDLFQVRRPLFTPGGHVAYLPNDPEHELTLLCDSTTEKKKKKKKKKAPLRHVKFLAKADRQLPPDLCGRLPDDVPFKAPRDADFSSS